MPSFRSGTVTEILSERPLTARLDFSEETNSMLELFRLIRRARQESQRHLAHSSFGPGGQTRAAARKYSLYAATRSVAGFTRSSISFG